MSDRVHQVESRPGAVLRRIVWRCARGIVIALWLATAVTLFAKYHWIPDLLANLRVQQCLVLFLASFSLLAFRRWFWLCVTALCIAIHAPYPLEEMEVFELNTEIESIMALVRIGGRSYRLFATHPLPPMGRRGYQLRNAHLQSLAKLIRDSDANRSRPTVLVGDLNLTPWSPHFNSFQVESGLRRATVGFDVTPTWYRYPAFPFGLILDHAMVSSEMRCAAHTVGPAMGSDHRSVTVTLIPANRSAREPWPPAGRAASIDARGAPSP